MHLISPQRLHQLYRLTNDRQALELLNRITHSEFASDHDLVMFERIELKHLEKNNNVRFIANYKRGGASNRHPH